MSAIFNTSGLIKKPGPTDCEKIGRSTNSDRLSSTEIMRHYSYITRCESFSAAHRLHSPMMNDQENLAIYGKCNHPNSHGHNYKVEITMRGRIDPTTGMVINIKDLKECMQVVLENLDHRNLDKDVEYFFTKPSTTENLAVYIWTEFQKAYIAHPIGTMSNARLYRVKICETDSNYVEYMGEGEED